MAKIEYIGRETVFSSLKVVTLSTTEAHMIICALSAQIVGKPVPFGISSSITVEDEAHIPSRITFCIDHTDK